MASASMQYSDLEVVHGEISKWDSGIQVRTETGMIPVGQHYELEVADSGGRSNDGYTLEATELMSREQIKEKGKWSFKAFSRRQRWLAIGGALTLVLLIALASILGVVMNSREHKYFSPSTTSPTAEDTSTPILASTSAPASTSGSASPPTTQSTATGTSSNLIRNIAALSYTSNSVNTTRLYYQDGSGPLIEATTSDSSSSTTPTWTTTKLNYTAINGSAIAATVTKPGVEPMEVTLAFVGTKNILHSIHSTLNNSTSTINDANSWTSGSLSLQNISVYSATRLSVLYNPCIDCKYNIIVSYQAPDGYIYIKNQTMSTITDVDTRDNSTDSWNTEFAFGVQFGTAMALEKVNTNGIHRASLYWQWKGSNITIQDWYPGIGWTGTGHWLTESFYSYTNLTPISTGSTDQVLETGFRAWFVLLTLCDTGVRMDVWGGRAETWILINNHPDEMSNSTTNKKVYKDVKVTDLGIAFLVKNNGTAADIVEMWRLRDDMISWDSLGTVDLEGAWG